MGLLGQVARASGQERLRAAPAVEIRGVSLTYNGRLAVSSVTLAVETGQRLAVVGPNGAGKSTLFKGLVGLVPAAAGEFRINGQPASRALSSVAYVPQREEIDWSFPVTVMDVVLMGRYGRLGWLRRPGAEDRAVAERLLGQMGIGHLSARPIGELSGGQQQRAFLARALAQEPSVLILDEPFAGIDAPTRDLTLQMLDGLDRRSVTLMVSTHDLEMAAEHFDRLLLLNRRAVAYGTPAEVLDPAVLAEAFGAQRILTADGQKLTALTSTCCPPEGSADPGDEGAET